MCCNYYISMVVVVFATTIVDIANTTNYYSLRRFIHCYHLKKKSNYDNYPHR